MHTAPPLPKLSFKLFDGCTAYSTLSMSYDGPIPEDLLAEAREYDRVQTLRNAMEASRS